MNVRDQMRQSAIYHKNHPAIIAGDRRLTFGEAWERGIRMANLLISLGLKPGDRVASLEDNTIEAVDFFLGAVIANVVRVPLYARNARASHQHMMAHTDCKVAIVAEKYADQLEGMIQEVPSLEHIVIRNAGYEDWLASFSNVDPNTPVEDDDLYVIRHTGGTTGKAKGVSFTHQAWLDIGFNWFYPMPALQVGDVCMHIAPISHASGYLFVPTWLGGGVNLVVEKYQPAPVVDLMVSERVAYLFVAPTMVLDLLHVPNVESRDWSALKVILIGAAPITEATVLKAHALWGNAICQLYGQTEAVPATITMATDWVRKVPGSNPTRSLGKVHPFCQVEIRDPATKEALPFGTEGEICIRVAGQMPGYWKDPESSAKAIVRGFVHTSDMGYLDENGYLYMYDRKDDMIISGGYNIWPMEIENVLANHPQVIEVVAFGVPHDRFGEAPYVMVKVKDVAAVTAEELIELCAQELGSYKKPSHVQIGTESLPRTPVGKISRKMIRAPFWEGLGRRK
ncbi:predicted AMP-dependent synthetase and ligase [gamma proteobacterium HdN1]|nr:predicted AMP-dependent synthetase and ligase [gamma proteobacterium HdN1]